MAALRWALTILLVLNLLGAIVAGFGDFGPDATRAVSRILICFIVSAAGCAGTLGVMEWFEEREADADR